MFEWDSLCMTSVYVSIYFTLWNTKIQSHSNVNTEHCCFVPVNWEKFRMSQIKGGNILFDMYVRCVRSKTRPFISIFVFIFLPSFYCCQLTHSRFKNNAPIQCINAWNAAMVTENGGFLLSWLFFESYINYCVWKLSGRFVYGCFVITSNRYVRIFFFIRCQVLVKYTQSHSAAAAAAVISIHYHHHIRVSYHRYRTQPEKTNVYLMHTIQNASRTLTFIIIKLLFLLFLLIGSFILLLQCNPCSMYRIYKTTQKLSSLCARFVFYVILYLSLYAASFHSSTCVPVRERP